MACTAHSTADGWRPLSAKPPQQAQRSTAQHAAHHVLQQHRQQARQEGAQHVRLDLALAEGAPKLARLHSHPLVAVLPRVQGCSVSGCDWGEDETQI